MRKKQYSVTVKDGVTMRGVSAERIVKLGSDMNCGLLRLAILDEIRSYEVVACRLLLGSSRASDSI